MAYIKISEEGLCIPNQYVQSFQFPINVIADRTQILKLIENRNISDTEIEVVKFLIDSIFATPEQIERYCRLKNLTDGYEKDIWDILKHLTKIRLINRFMLGESKAEKGEFFPTDARSYFCGTSGAAKLLEHMSTSPDIVDWEPGDVQKVAGLISRNLVMTEFRLRIDESCPGKLDVNKSNYFRMIPRLIVGKTKVIPSADFRIHANGSDKPFICDVFMAEDKTVESQERISRLASILTSQAWKKYYTTDETEPTLLILTDTDDTAFEIAKLIHETSKIETYFFTTLERMRMPLGEEGAFLKYDTDEDKMIEARAATFAVE